MDTPEEYSGTPSGSSSVAKEARRGFLVGISLAELMLVVVFCLLLLYQQKERVLAALPISASGAQLLSQAGSDSIPPHITSKLEGTFNELINCIRFPDDPSCQPERKPEESSGDENPLVPKDPEEKEPESLSREEIEKELKQLRNENNALRDAVAEVKAGGRSICTWLPGTSNGLTGPSISIGTFLVERDGVTLVVKNLDDFSADLVDVRGKPFNKTDAVNELAAWPACTKLSLEDFSTLAQRFVDIGDREVEHRTTCRFAASTYVVNDAEGITLQRSYGTVSNYFFPAGQQLSRADFENLVLEKSECAPYLHRDSQGIPSESPSSRL